jgi:hypothetical protein
MIRNANHSASRGDLLFAGGIGTASKKQSLP